MAGLWEFAKHVGKGFQNATVSALDKVEAGLDYVPSAASAIRDTHARWGRHVEERSDHHWNAWGRNMAVSAAVGFFAPKLASTLSNFHQPRPGVRYRWDQDLITPTFARSLGYTAARTAASVARFHNRPARPARVPYVRYGRQLAVGARYRYQGAGFGAHPKWKTNYRQQNRVQKFKGKGKFRRY